MTDKYLHRDDAPFGDGLWEKIDAVIVHRARSRMSARRLLHVDGPHGLALKAFGCEGGESTEGVAEGVELRVPCMVPLPSVESAFRLSIRDIAAHEQSGQPLDLAPAAKAAAACARQEDELVFNGAKALGVPGLLNAKGAQTCKFNGWEETGSAVDNILQCVNKLDSAGFTGPYALALAPLLFNTLFRRYPQGNMTELDHLREVVTDGIVKAPAIRGGGVLVTSATELACIVVGQDLAASFIGPEGRSYEFSVSETAALRLTEPASICLLQ